MKVKNKILSVSTIATLSFLASQSTADQVFNDEVIIVASLCVGVDCVNGENFNFDTVRLKENNLRIKFQDTSSTSSFPSVDWQLTANDSRNGGQNYFAIDNVDTSQTPFKVAGGAKTNALYIADNSFVGLGTSTPLVNLHLKSGNSPALRLEQDGSSGFSAQTWDVAGNEANFFVRDVSNASRIPFKIVPGAPSNSIFVANDGDIGFETSTPDGIFDIAHPADANNHALLVSSVGNLGINVDNGFLPNGLLDVQTTGGISRLTVASDGDVGIGTSSPNGRLHIIDADSPNGQNSAVIFANTNGGPNAVLLEVQNAGNSFIKMTDTSDNSSWFVGSRDDGKFSLSHTNGGGRLLELDQSGNLITTGTINGVSTREAKENIEALDLNLVLSLLSSLDVAKWNYKKDPDDVKHIGPMAEDFHNAFSLNGANATDRIAFSDGIGVAFAAIKALIKKNEDLENQINEIKASR